MWYVVLSIFVVFCLLISFSLAKVSGWCSRVEEKERIKEILEEIKKEKEESEVSST